MILQSSIANITRNLEILSQKDSGNISSREQLKQVALTCLINLIEKAPESEYKSLTSTKKADVIIGYNLNILCLIAKNEKSKQLRVQSLEIILALIERLDNLHSAPSGIQRCSLESIVAALPGVSCALFQIITSDNKLPKSLLTVAIKTLTKLITAAFQSCSYNKNGQHLFGKDLLETCDNLAVRINLLFSYITSNSESFHIDVKHEMLNFCKELVTSTSVELLTRTFKSIVRYLAFTTSTVASYGTISTEIELKNLLIVDYIRDKISEPNSEEGDKLDSTIMTCASSCLDELDSNCMTMLISERQSELAMLNGLLKLMPQTSLTTFLETNEKRAQLLGVLIRLTEFSSQQPLLFLTDAPVNLEALEVQSEKIYTTEKRFKHLNDKELELVKSCCYVLGRNSDWLFLNDIIFNEVLHQQQCVISSQPNNLFIAQQLLEGCTQRCDIPPRAFRSTQKSIDRYIDQIQEQHSELALVRETGAEDVMYSDESLRMVISIETLVTLVKMHLKFVSDPSGRIIILKNLLCPLLNWCSSSSRAISEASLNVLTQCARLYGHNSTKEFVEHNVDYIINGVSLLLDNFACNSDVTNVLAITFKLSSIKTFYYFSDVYEKVFKILGRYHYTNKAKSIALLFYRTLSILSSWSQVDEGDNEIPLKSAQSLRAVLEDLDIDRRINKLRRDAEDARDFKARVERAIETEAKMNERKVIEDIESQRKKMEEENGPENEVNSGEDTDKKKIKPPEIVLTEKILKQCIGLISSNCDETKILALRASAFGLQILRNDEDTLLPLVHQLWSPLISRLSGNYVDKNLELNICAFECLVAMATHSKDFLKRRALDSILPRLCLFLRSQASQSRGKRDYDPYCMTTAYKCQLKILTKLGLMAYHIQFGYTNLWRVVSTMLLYLRKDQVESLRNATRTSLHYLIALDADCVWYFAKQEGLIEELPFDLIYQQ